MADANDPYDLCRFVRAQEEDYVQGRSASEIFGSPDDLKLRSCATLFARVSPPNSVFEQLLDKFFQGGHDERTVQLMDAAAYAKKCDDVRP